MKPTVCRMVLFTPRPYSRFGDSNFKPRPVAAVVTMVYDEIGGDPEGLGLIDLTAFPPGGDLPKSHVLIPYGENGEITPDKLREAAGSWSWPPKV